MIFPHPGLQGVHLLLHITTEHSADVCLNFHNFPTLHVMVRKGNQRWPVLGKMADLNVKAGDKSRGTSGHVSVLVSFVCVSLPCT